MNKEQAELLRQAFLEAEARELDERESAAPPVSASPAFERRMTRMIKARCAFYGRWRYNTAFRRMGVAAACVLLAVSMTLSVSALREPFVEMLFKPDKNTSDTAPLRAEDNPKYFYYTTRKNGNVERYHLRTGESDELCGDLLCDHTPRDDCRFTHAYEVQQDEHFVYFMRNSESAVVNGECRERYEIVRYEPITRTYTVLDEYESSKTVYTRLWIHGGYLYHYHNTEECEPSEFVLRRIDLDSKEIKTYPKTSILLQTIQNGRLWFSNGSCIYSTDLDLGDRRDALTAPEGWRIGLEAVGRTGKLYYTEHTQEVQNRFTLCLYDPETGETVRTEESDGQITEAHEINGRLYYVHWNKRANGRQMTLLSWGGGEEPPTTRFHSSSAITDVTSCGTCLLFMTPIDGKATLLCIDTEAEREATESEEVQS